MRDRLRTAYRSHGIEPFVWCLAILFLALFDPTTHTNFTLCPLHNLGLKICPGCGLGRSISFFLHGDLSQSLESHILGIPATGMLIARIVSLLKNVQDTTPPQYTTNNTGSSYAQRNAVDAKP